MPTCLCVKLNWIWFFKGSGPANPGKIDSFNEKVGDLLGKTSLCALLPEEKKNSCPRSTNSQAILNGSDANPSAFSSLQRERSAPAFIPSAPSKGISQRRGQRTSSSASTDLLNPSPTVNRDAGPFPRHHNNTLQDGFVEPNQTKYLNARVCHRCADSLGSVDAQLSQQLSPEQQEMLGKSSVCEGRRREKHRVQFDRIPRAVSEDITTCAGATEQDPDLRNYPARREATQVHRGISPVELSAEEEHFKNEKVESSNLVKSREKRHRFQGSHLLPRPPVLPGIVGGQAALLHLQNSFSKTAAHRNFNSGATYAAANLNDNVVSGKKHNFFGINSCSLHG